MEDFTIEERVGEERRRFVAVIRNMFSLESILRLHGELSDLLQRGGVDLTIDLSEAGKFSKEGVGMLIGIVSSIRSDGGRAVITNPSGRFLADIRIIGADRYFDIDR